MGWNWCHEVGTWKNGKYVIDRKDVCDGYLIMEEQEENGHWRPRQEVLKSSMVGTVYYAAVKTMKRDGGSTVWAAVFPTATNSRDYFNFGYKAMDETCGPCECQCPKGILKLLTETDSDSARGWRERCWKYHEDQKRKRAMASLPIGSRISFQNSMHLKDGRKPGDEIILTKVERMEYGKKKEYWSDGHYRWPSSQIPSAYQIVA